MKTHTVRMTGARKLTQQCVPVTRNTVRNITSNKKERTHRLRKNVGTSNGESADLEIYVGTTTVRKEEMKQISHRL